MLQLPVLRWGQPYTSMDVDQVVHFSTGEPIAKVSRANGGLIQRDMRKAAARPRRAARDSDRRARSRASAAPASSTRTPSCRWATASQTPDEFVRAQSGTTGIPERLCRANMKKNTFVLAEMGRILAVAHARPRSRRARRGATAKSAASRSAFRPKARCSASCCRRTHPACTRCGCRSSRCRSAWCSSRGRRSRGRRSAWPRRSSQAGHSARGDLHLSGRRRRRRRGARGLRRAA